MKITPQIQSAIDLATKLHAGQMRKDGSTPYVEHPKAVAEILSEFVDDENVLIAALMHDTIEDVPGYTFEKLVEDCGREVADLVEGVTEDGYPAGYAEMSPEEKVVAFEAMLKRQAEKIERAGPGSLAIAVADKIHNLESTIAGVEKEGLDYLKKFKMRTGQKLAYYRDIMERARSHVHPALIERLEKALEKSGEIFT